MKTQLFLSLSFFLLSISILNAQWDGREDKDIIINQEPNSTYDATITVTDSLSINGQNLNTSCVQADIVELKAVDVGDSIRVTVCNETKSFSYIANKVFITNGSGFRLTFSKEQKPDYDFPFTISPTVIDIYYDALVLELGSTSQKSIVLNKYGLTKTATPHKFLADVHSEVSQLQSSSSSSSTDQTESDFNDSGASGISITKLADGFAKFIASQFKKELTISFFNKFKAKINDPSTRDLQVLFKSTHAQLNLIDDQFVHYQAYLSSLRQTMEYDCHLLPERFKIILEDPNSQLSNLLANHADFQYVLDNILTFGLALKDSVHVGEALADLDFSQNVGQGVASENLKASFESVQLLSESLRNINTGPEDSYWVSPSQMNALVGDTTLLTLYLGLVAEKSKMDGITFTTGSLYDIMNTQTANDVRGVVESMISSVKSIEEIISYSKSGLTEGNKDIIAMQYFDAATNLINTSAHLAPILPEEDAEKLTKFNTLAGSINNMTQSFITQKYALGLLNLSKVITGIDSTSKTLEKINGFITNQGLFIAQMAESDNSDDIVAILENFAAPTGSWRDKRTAEWNIALDSYIGPALYKIQDEDARFAFSTPVGASITIPFNHVTFFVSIADIGPITSFRLTNDTSEIANLFLKEILSPGVFASVNFGDNYPITLNAGYQQFPLLEKVGEVENTVNVNRKGGFSGSIVVNIPLFTLYNERKD